MSDETSDDRFAEGPAMFSLPDAKRDQLSAIDRLRAAIRAATGIKDPVIGIDHGRDEYVAEIRGYHKPDGTIAITDLKQLKSSRTSD